MAKQQPKHPTREAWLNEVARLMEPKFKEVGSPIPGNVRVSVGFTSAGIRSMAIGECWDSGASKDKHFEIFLRPNLDDVIQVTGTLCHELIHAAVGLKAKHGKAFKKVALALGLTGKMTATVPGDGFKQWVRPILEKVGPFPHAALEGRSSIKPKQTTRMVKCECDECGYVARTTKKWIEAKGPPHCPDHGAMTVEERDDEEGDE